LILQEIEWTRIFLIVIIQFMSGVFFLWLAYKILKRNKSRLTILLSSFYFSEAIGLILNVIYLPLKISILYAIMFFLFSFGQIFLVIFLINLNKMDGEFSFKKDLIVIFSYAIILLLLLNFPGGITINEDTNWRPVYSWSFLISSYMFYTCFINIPTIILSIKIYKKFEDKNLKRKLKNLKRKLKFFFIGINGFLCVYYGTLLYITWDNNIFRTIWCFLSLIIIPLGFLIYYGIGKDL